MLVHTVLFWLREDLSADTVAEFRAGLETLKGIQCAEVIYVGSPAATKPRPGVIIDDYDFCLTVVLKDVKAHDAYQVDPLHKAFIKTYSPFFKQVRIYDAD